MSSNNFQSKKVSGYARGNESSKERLDDDIQQPHRIAETNRSHTKAFIPTTFTVPPPSPPPDNDLHRTLGTSNLANLASEDEVKFSAFLERYSSLVKASSEQAGSATSEHDPTLSCMSLGSTISFAEWRETSGLPQFSEGLKTGTELTEHPHVDIILLSQDGKPTTHPVYMCSHTADTDMLIVPQLLLAEIGGVTDRHGLSNARAATKASYESREEPQRQPSAVAQERYSALNSHISANQAANSVLEAPEVAQGEKEISSEESSAPGCQVLTPQIQSKCLEEQISSLANSHTENTKASEEERLQEREAALEKTKELEKRNGYLQQRLSERENSEHGIEKSLTDTTQNADWSTSDWRTPRTWGWDRKGDSQLPIWERDSVEFVPWPLETIVIHSHQNIRL